MKGSISTIIKPFGYKVESVADERVLQLGDDGDARDLLTALRILTEVLQRSPNVDSVNYSFAIIFEVLNVKTLEQRVSGLVLRFLLGGNVVFFREFRACRLSIEATVRLEQPGVSFNLDFIIVCQTCQHR